MEDEAQEETFMSDYEQGKLLKGILDVLCCQPIKLFQVVSTYFRISLI